MLTPGMPGPMALCGGRIPPPKFFQRHKLSDFIYDGANLNKVGLFEYSVSGAGAPDWTGLPGVQVP